MSKEIINDLSEKQLNLGYWLITHQEQLKKWLKIFLIAVAGVFWLITFIELGIYLAHLPDDQKIIKGIIENSVDFKSFQEKHRLAPLEFGSPMVIYNGQNRYDFAVSVANPNLDRGVKRIEYQFVSGNFISPTGTAVILAAQRTYLVSLGNTSRARLNGASLKILSQEWQRLTEKPDFSQPAVFIDGIDIVKDQFEQGKSRYVASFIAENLTNHNFWTADFLVALYSGQRLVGINKVVLDSFLSGEKRPAEVSWYDPINSVSRVEVFPAIDVYSPENRFLTPGQVQEE